MRNFLLRLYFRLCRAMFGIKKNTFLFISFHGRSYSDNPRALSEKLHAMHPECKIIWAFKNPEEKKKIVPNYVHVISVTKKLAYYKNLACSGVVIDNFIFPQIPKNKKQIFIQTWHGDKPIKKVIHDVDTWTLHISEEDSGFCDYAIAGSVAGEKQYRKAFRYTGEILSFGMPRNDVLVRNDQVEVDSIKNKIGMKKDIKYILYAPTFRDNLFNDGKSQMVETLNLSKLLDELEDLYSCKCNCLLRSHPIVSGIGVDTQDERVIDVCKYEDMADLMLVADMLITDYSSSAGDFALLDRPVILYQYDLDRYIESDRNLCFDMEDSPFFRASNQTELEEVIKSLDEDKIIKNCKQVREFFGDYETGESSKKIIETIFDRRRK